MKTFNIPIHFFYFELINRHGACMGPCVCTVGKPVNVVVCQLMMYSGVIVSLLVCVQLVSC